MTLFTLFFCNFHFNQLKFLHTNDTMNLNKESYYMNNKEISIFTVAEKAGVSIATVSRVLNNKGSVKQSTCNKVFEAAHELGYEIKENWKHLIILNLPNIANPCLLYTSTYPEMSRILRKLMPHTYFLVPGYGAQGGTAEDLKYCFNEDGLGAIVNSSRGIIAAYKKDTYAKFGPEHFAEASRQAVIDMVADINSVL